MKILSSKSFNGKEYSIDDVRGFLDTSDFNLDSTFYGGRVDKIGGTNIAGLYLLVESHEVIDLMIIEEEYEDLDEEEYEEVEEVPFSEEIDYQDYTNAELRAMLEEAGVEVPSRATKDELIALFD